MRTNRLGACAVLAGVVLLAGGALPLRPALPREEAERLRRANDELRRRLELASGQSFYFALDPAGGRLDLMLGGVVLRRFVASDVAVGTPRALFLPRRVAQDWRERNWSGGRLVPARERERIEIRPDPSAPEGSEPPIPPEPEALYRVPNRYRIRFDDGLSLEIVPRGGGALGLGALASRTGDLFAALRIFGEQEVRVRVALSPEDAAALYRAAPPDVALLVITGGGS